MFVCALPYAKCPLKIMCMSVDTSLKSVPSSWRGPLSYVVIVGVLLTKDFMQKLIMLCNMYWIVNVRHGAAVCAPRRWEMAAADAILFSVPAYNTNNNFRRIHTQTHWQARTPTMQKKYNIFPRTFAEIIAFLKTIKFILWFFKPIWLLLL